MWTLEDTYIIQTPTGSSVRTTRATPITNVNYCTPCDITDCSVVISDVVIPSSDIVLKSMSPKSISALLSCSASLSPSPQSIYSSNNKDMVITYIYDELQTIYEDFMVFPSNTNNYIEGKLQKNLTMIYTLIRDLKFHTY